jgi:hypothetical protein
MEYKNTSRRLIRKLVSVAQRFREIAPAAGQAARKPAVMGHIFLTAHRAQIFLVAAILAILFLFSPLLDSGLRTIFPEKTSKKLFGLVKKKRRNPIQEKAYDWAMLSLWILTVGETLILVWMNIPRGMAKAGARAKELENYGDKSSNDKPLVRLKYYNKAFGLALDSEDQSQILMKIRQISSYPSQLSQNSSGITKVAGSGNITRHNAENTNFRPKPDSIGPNGRYILSDELGRGGMGVVYQAWDEALDRKIALKKLPQALTDDMENLARFEREAKLLARLSHPAILQIYDLFQDRGEYWMALEYIDGGDLADYLLQHGSLSIAIVTDIGQKIADGMAYAHRQGIIHRDLKPGNILLSENTDPKIADFGLAKMPVSSELTGEGVILGSPRYMSPEQASGSEIDKRSDIYSLGIILYKMVTGQTPFNGDTSQILAQHITQLPSAPREYSPDIPPELEELILKMLAKDPDDRIQDMTEISESLAALTPVSMSSPSRITS